MVQQVKYIYRSEAEWSESYNITTGIKLSSPNFKMRIVYQGRGIDSDRIMGLKDDDDNDLRVFQPSFGLTTYYDLGNSREERENISLLEDGTEYDITFGNYYAKYTDGTTNFLEGDAVSDVNTTEEVKVDVGSLKVSEVYIWDNDVLVFSGYAAIDGDSVGLYNTVDSSFHIYTEGSAMSYEELPPKFYPSVYSLKFTKEGGSATFDVTADYAWSCTVPTWATLSATGGEAGTTTITVTAPAYEIEGGKRDEFIIFTDSESQTFTFKIRQTGIITSVSNLILGDNTLTTLYMGEEQINTIYLGENTVYTSGPFKGLRVSPKILSFNKNTLSNTFSITSTEDWTINSDLDWITFSSTSGTGDGVKVKITATTTEQSEKKEGSFTVTTANFSATVNVKYNRDFYIEVAEEKSFAVTDLSFNSDFDRVEVDYLYKPAYARPTKGAYNQILSAGNTSFREGYTSQSDAFYFVFNDNDYYKYNSPSIEKNKPFILKNVIFSSTSLTVDGVVKATYDKAYPFSTEPLVIFNNNTKYPSDYCEKGTRIGAFRLYDANGLVASVVPAEKDGVACFYNETSGVYYTPKQGSFSLGIIED